MKKTQFVIAFVLSSTCRLDPWRRAGAGLRAAEMNKALARDNQSMPPEDLKKLDELEKNFLQQPIKKAFACSLGVFAVRALPRTMSHVWLGHSPGR
jgi:hypothetical protein